MDGKLFKIEAEEVIIGTLMLENGKIEESLSLLEPSDFYVDDLRNTYKVILELYDNKKPFDLLTISDKLQKQGYDIEKSYLAHIAENSLSLSNFGTYVEMVHDYSKKRKLMELSGTIESLCTNSEPLPKIVEIVESKLEEVSVNSYNQNSTSSSQETVISAIQILDDITKGKKRALTTPWNTFNNFMGGGIHQNDLTVVAGRPSMGKTTFVLNMLLGFVVNDSAPSLIFSIEMAKEELMFKLLSHLGEIKGQNIRTGELDSKQLHAISMATTAIAKFPLYFNDKGAITIAEIKAITRRYKRQYNIKSIAIDYLQLVGTKGFSTDQRVGEISHITRELKVLAKDLNIAVILLSQLNRQVENRIDKKPLLSDLRDSGAIEQDADNVVLLYRPEVYNATPNNKGQVDIIIAKQRNGEVGSIPLHFKGEFSRFSEEKEIYNEN